VTNVFGSVARRWCEVRRHRRGVCVCVWSRTTNIIINVNSFVLFVTSAKRGGGLFLLQFVWLSLGLFIQM